MKMPKEYAQQIIEGVINSIGATSIVEREEVVISSGEELLNMGIYKLLDGRPVLNGFKYWYGNRVNSIVDHRKNLILILELSDTLEHMNELIAGYMVRYGLPPVHLQTT